MAQTPRAEKQATRKPQPRRTRTGQLSGVQVMFAAILAIGLILGINFSTRLADSRPLNEYYADVEAEIEALQQEQATLVAERDFAESDAYVEQWARQDGKMIRPGEVLVVVQPDGVRPVESATPSPFVEVETSPPKPENWMLWWSLFFDTEPPEF